jgi:hypothetical protein
MSQIFRTSVHCFHCEVVGMCEDASGVMPRRGDSGHRGGRGWLLMIYYDAGGHETSRAAFCSPECAEKHLQKGVPRTEFAGGIS